MSTTTGANAGGIRERDSRPVSTTQDHSRRLSTETKSAYKTTELVVYIAAVAAVLIASAIIDENDAGGFGARQAWLYVTILTVGYMLSRGFAKSGSRDPYDDGGR